MRGLDDSRPSRPCSLWTAILCCHRRRRPVERGRHRHRHRHRRCLEGHGGRRPRPFVEAWRDPTAWEGETTVGELTLANAQWARVGYDELVLHGWDLAATILQIYESGTEELDVIEPFIEETAAEPAAEGLWGPSFNVEPPSPGSNDSSRCLDPIAELTLEGSLGDVQIVVSVKKTSCTVDELANDVGVPA